MSNFEIIRAAMQNKEASHLTVELAKSIKGKEIIAYAPGYRDQYVCERFVVGDVISEWDLAAKDETASGYANRQEYWKSIFNDKRVEESKQKIVLLKENGENTYMFAHDGSVFTCGDVDRFVSFVIAPN
jgi:hypothetical protein